MGGLWVFPAKKGKVPGPQGLPCPLLQLLVRDAVLGHELVEHQDSDHHVHLPGRGRSGPEPKGAQISNGHAQNVHRAPRVTHVPPQFRPQCWPVGFIQSPVFNVPYTTNTPPQGKLLAQGQGWFHQLILVTPCSLSPPIPLTLNPINNFHWAPPEGFLGFQVRL